MPTAPPPTEGLLSEIMGPPTAPPPTEMPPSGAGVIEPGPVVDMPPAPVGPAGGSDDSVIDNMFSGLAREEGFQEFPYDDAGTGLAVGYGRNLRWNPLTPAEQKKYGAKGDGTGWDIDKPYTEQDAESWSKGFLRGQLQTVSRIVGRDTWSSLNGVQKGVLLQVAYQGGADEVEPLVEALRAGDFQRAGQLIVEGKIGKAAPARAQRHARSMTQ